MQPTPFPQKGYVHDSVVFYQYNTSDHPLAANASFMTCQRNPLRRAENMVPEVGEEPANHEHSSQPTSDSGKSKSDNKGPTSGSEEPASHEHSSQPTSGSEEQGQQYKFEEEQGQQYKFEEEQGQQYKFEEEQDREVAMELHRQLNLAHNEVPNLAYNEQHHTEYIPYVGNVVVESPNSSNNGDWESGFHLPESAPVRHQFRKYEFPREYSAGDLFTKPLDDGVNHLYILMADMGENASKWNKKKILANPNMPIDEGYMDHDRNNAEYWKNLSRNRNLGLGHLLSASKYLDLHSLCRNPSASMWFLMPKVNSRDDKRELYMCMAQHPGVEFSNIVASQDESWPAITAAHPSLSYAESVELIKKFGWPHLYLAANPNIDIETMQQNHSLHWSSLGISWNPRMTWGFVEKIPDFLLDWDGISCNTFVNIDIVRANPTANWNWEYLSANPAISPAEMLMSNHLPWSVKGMSRNPALTSEFVLNNQDVEWDLDSMSENPFSQYVPYYDSDLFRKLPELERHL